MRTIWSSWNSILFNHGTSLDTC